MPRAARISILRDNRNPRLPHMVNIPATLSATGERQRPHFASRSEAERCKAAEERRLHNYSEKSFGLTDADKIMHAECKEIIATHPERTIRDACLLAVRVWDQESSSIPLAQLGAEFTSHGGEDNLSSTYLSKTSALLVRLSDALKGVPTSAVRPEQIDGWLRGQNIGAVTRNNYRRHLSAAFGFAVRKGWCRENPCERVYTVSTPAAPVIILTCEQAEAILRAADPRIVAWFALGLFAGLRPTEAERVAWNDIGEKTIRIHASIAKTRRNRFVPVLDALPAWLALAERDRRGTVSFSRALFRKAIKAAGYGSGEGMRPWPADCLRHSFGSYRWPIIQNENQLAMEMGNSPGVIISHYREVTTPETANQFFNILATPL